MKKKLTGVQGKGCEGRTRPRGSLSSSSLTRRTFIQGSMAAALTGCYSVPRPSMGPGLDRAGRFGELDATSGDGIDLYVEKKSLLVGGRPGSAVTINGSIPGPVIRMKEGREAVIRVHNGMDESTSVHWHGILLPFDMDGVPGISFDGIPAGETFTYRYPLKQHGTYWYHSHTGLQEQLGHYGQLIVEPAGKDVVEYDLEYTVVLSDWTFEDPHTVLRNLKTIEGYYNFQRPTLINLDNQVRDTSKSLGEVLMSRLRWRWMRMDPTDIADVTGVTYSYLMNGHTADENWTGHAEPGQRVRLRIVNASTMTYYDFRVPGVPMTVVQADGQDVKPVETDELRIAVAETYDVVITMPDAEAVTLFAETMDRSGYTRGTLSQPGLAAADSEVPLRRPRPMRTMEDMGMMMGGGGHAGHAAKPEPHAMASHGAGGALPTTGLPERLKHDPDGHGPGSITMAHTAYRQVTDPGAGLGEDGRRVLSYSQLQCLETPEDRRAPTREFDLHLTGNMLKYIWGFDGKKWSESDMIQFVYGERLRINFINDTMMAHPIHLHGMWMDLYTGGRYEDNPRKHTVSVQPAELLTVDITADAPGQWAFHCHLLYHMEMGMFRTVAVVRELNKEGIDATS